MTTKQENALNLVAKYAHQIDLEKYIKKPDATEMANLKKKAKSNYGISSDMLDELSPLVDAIRKAKKHEVIVGWLGGVWKDDPILDDYKELILEMV